MGKTVQQRRQIEILGSLKIQEEIWLMHVRI
jgi:hypothetical protein